MAAPETDDDIGRLFSIRPADFVGERNATAKKLKAAGRRDDAAIVEKLPRPTLSVWAVNQIARQEPALVRRLADATTALQGGRPGGSLPYADLLVEHREILKALRRKAEEILNASGLRSTPDLLTQVVHDLRAGISSLESRPLIESGRLVRDVGDDSAVNPFAGAPETAPGPRAPALAPAPTSGATDGHATRDAARAREEARARDEARAFQRRRIENLRERVATARAASERDEREVDAARRSLKEAERRFESSSVALAEVSAALQAAEAEVDP